MRRIQTVILLMLLAVTSSAFAASRRRVALVIGVPDSLSDTASIALADAAAVRDKLRTLHVNDNDLLECIPCKHDDMEAKIREFREKLQTADEAVFYYSGHGAEIDGHNYMLPADAVPVDEKNFYTVTVPVGDVYEAMRVGSSHFNLVIIDACRDNPFVTAGGAIHSTLAEPKYEEIPVGTLIAFSTRPGTLSIDGDGPHSPYTDSLLAFIKERGMTIQEYFMRVRNRVQDQTSQAQTPWETTSQTVDFAFSSPPELEIAIRNGDDEVIVMANGQALMWGSDGRTPRAIRLRTGDNVVRLFVHNDKTFHGNNPIFGAREGWQFDVQLRVMPDDEGADPKPAPPPLSCGDDHDPRQKTLCGSDDTTPIPVSRWGATFLAAAARVRVHHDDGSIEFSVIENEVWRDNFSVADNTERDELELSLAWPFWHERKRLYDDEYPGRLRPVQDLFADAIAAHTAAAGQDPAAKRGSSAQAHRAAAARLQAAAPDQRREALLRLLHWEIERQAHGPTVNLQWSVGKDRERFANAVRQHDFASLRRDYFVMQEENQNARNVLNLLSNAQIERIVSTTAP